jgi:hypothetical protein
VENVVPKVTDRQYRLNITLEIAKEKVCASKARAIGMNNYRTEGVWRSGCALPQVTPFHKIAVCSILNTNAGAEWL